MVLFWNFAVEQEELRLPLRKSGIDITGLDFTPSMLKRAREKSQEQGVDCNRIEGDIEVLNPIKNLILFYSFQFSTQHLYL